ncbi:TRAP transporter small permease [Roseinatronobacter sp. S2]|uniref:TRAP transporter small permease n=1 Tax=Roseinatronobacter sp. S2 TaxID=3035471 RepID=UPI0024101B02|nr:TRAP transporter small permease [Roseinatronobacter sp. S2]WFE75844.1 TRAP transporter small permease [Roseinatronobacter sp. S2]
MTRIATHAARVLAISTEIIAGLLLITVTVLNLTQVGGRYFFSTGFSWTEEVMRYSMIWLMMLGSVACIFRLEHMGIEVLEGLVRPNLVRFVKSALYSVAAIFCVVILYYGLPLALRNAAQTAPASGIPMIIPYAALPVGAALMLVQVALSWLSGFEPDDYGAVNSNTQGTDTNGASQ